MSLLSYSRHDAAFHLETAQKFLAASKPHHAAFHLGLARELAATEATATANAITNLPPSDIPRVGSSAARQYYWRMYDGYVRKVASPDARASKAANFHKSGFALGALPRALAIRLQEAIMASPIVPYSSAERLPGFVASNNDSKSDTVVNGHSRFRELSFAGRALLDEALGLMRDEVASYLGTPWRLLAVKSWTTPPGKPPVGMYGWHGDDWVGELLKIMIYLTPQSRKTGSLEIFSGGKQEFLEFPDPGRWVLFRNSDLVHRGVPGTDFERVVIEITLCRALAFDLRLRFPGLNAHWPEFPWVDALDPAQAATIQNFSPAEAGKLSLMKRILFALVTRFAMTGRLFKLRRHAERWKRLYLSSHPQ